MTDLRKRLQGLGEELAAEARVSAPAPDFADVRARMAAQRGAEVIAFPGASEAATPQPRSNVWWAFVGAAACAAVMLLFGLAWSGVQAWTAVEPRAVEANHTADDVRSTGEVRPVEPAPRPVVVPAPPGAPTATPPPASAPRQKPAVPKRRRQATSPAVSPAPAPETWSEKNTRALQAWRAGDLERARSIFEDIAQHGPARLAQLAWGELSTLTFQLDGAAAQRALRRRYLQAYPRGRFADDWSAALCRDASAAASEQCWRAHRRAHPDSRHAPSP